MQALPAQDRLRTPALVVDVAAADANIAAAAALAAGRLRPHLKAHKCAALMARQLAAGGCVGVTCATAHEAATWASRDGRPPAADTDPSRDVLVANQVVSDGELAALRAARAAGARVTVCVDDPAHVARLRAATPGPDEGDDRPLDVLVEVDVGQGRCGVPAGDVASVLALARLVRGTPGLRLRGLQGYHGHAVLLPDRAERGRHAAHTARVLAGLRAALRAAGLPCDVLSGGGTGTIALDVAAGVLDEVQAGSYVLGDASYARLTDLPFVPALWCQATVVSRRGERVVLDAGLKALSAEYGMPHAPGLKVLSLADEHATARVTDGDGPRIGDQVLLTPAHVDPTVNLHGTLHAVHPQGTVDRWAIDARRP